MTNKEAIYHLKTYDDPKKVHEAFDMAIKALEQEPCEDAVSRQAVLDIVRKFAVDEQDGSEYWRSKVNEYLCSIDEEVTKLPSVQPKPIECDDAVSREGMWKVVHQCEENNSPSWVWREMLSQLPSVQPKAKQGRWIGIDEEPHEDYECDKCGYVVSTYTANIEPHTEYKFCPNCGARMESEQNE